MRSHELRRYEELILTKKEKVTISDRRIVYRVHFVQIFYFALPITMSAIVRVQTTVFFVKDGGFRVVKPGRRQSHQARYDHPQFDLHLRLSLVRHPTARF